MRASSNRRHVALHQGGRFVFVMNELDSTVVSLALDDTSGKLTIIDTKPAVSAEARDAATGWLAGTGRSIDVGTPMCVKIVC
ncbi:lactonase family protein with 7-bladed beta-propeller [Mesorhizobium tianshanense]|uniref:Lactonase family protein with 7-bladed beta-propeller n=1 Tax=Mesorhizobium tianshanense TaxID=39844 RepID=A0A562PE15_9HYPH|nr:lactonase family protein with 7-bladed beta-propeller [Mesorhizobium tianshanense]